MIPIETIDLDGLLTQTEVCATFLYSYNRDYETFACNHRRRIVALVVLEQRQLAHNGNNLHSATGTSSSGCGF